VTVGAFGYSVEHEWRRLVACLVLLVGASNLGPPRCLGVQLYLVDVTSLLFAFESWDTVTVRRLVIVLRIRGVESILWVEDCLGFGSRLKSDCTHVSGRRTMDTQGSRQQRRRISATPLVLVSRRHWIQRCDIVGSTPHQAHCGVCGARADVGRARHFSHHGPNRCRTPSSSQKKTPMCSTHRR
jgi:hypothetical protein